MAEKDLADALVLTAQRIGTETMAALAGWDWLDALEASDPAKAEPFITERKKLNGEDEETSDVAESG